MAARRPRRRASRRDGPDGGAGGVPRLGRRPRPARADAGGVRPGRPLGPRCRRSPSRAGGARAARDRARAARAVRRRVVAAAACARRRRPQRGGPVAQRAGRRGAARLGAAASCCRRSPPPRSRPACRDWTTRPPGRCASSSTIACPRRCWRRWRCSMGTRAWEWRERWIRERGTLDAAVAGYVNARAAARSITGLDDDRAWEIRRARPDRRAGPGDRVAGGPVQRPRLALARAHARARAEDGAVDDRGPGRRPRLGDADRDGAPTAARRWTR